MFQEQDSLHKEHLVPAEPQTVSQETGQHVLRMADDSVGQSVYAVRSHWPVRAEKIDSVLMPSQGRDVHAQVQPLPQYYKESFFANDSLLHSELQGGRYGIPGDPVPYSLRNDGIATSAIIIGVLLLAYGVRRSSRFFLFNIKNFFHVLRNDSALERESASDKQYLIGAEFYTALVLALLFFFYANTYISDTFVTFSEYTLMGIYLAGMVGMFLFEHIAQAVVNWTLFTPRQGSLWVTTQLMTTAWIGILLTPMIFLLAYFGWEVQNALVYTISVVIFVKILLFYKCYQIFFLKKSEFLEIFLYFCTLEVIPPVLTWGILVVVANSLKVNF